MDSKAWYLSAAVAALCILAGIALYRAMHSTVGTLQVLLDGMVGKPATVAVAELQKFVRTDMFLSSSDSPLVAAVFRIGSTPTPLPASGLIAALGVDEQGIVRQVVDGSPVVSAKGDVQIVPL